MPFLSHLLDASLICCWPYSAYIVMSYCIIVINNAIWKKTKCIEAENAVHCSKTTKDRGVWLLGSILYPLQTVQWPWMEWLGDTLNQALHWEWVASTTSLPFFWADEIGTANKQCDSATSHSMLLYKGRADSNVFWCCRDVGLGFQSSLQGELVKIQSDLRVQSLVSYVAMIAADLYFRTFSLKFDFIRIILQSCYSPWCQSCLTFLCQDKLQKRLRIVNWQANLLGLLLKGSNKIPRGSSKYEVPEVSAYHTSKLSLHFGCAEHHRSLESRNRRASEVESSIS